MSVAILRSMYDSEEHFIRATTAMLGAGELRLLANGEDVVHYRWQTVLKYADDKIRSENLELAITEAGARRIG